MPCNFLVNLTSASFARFRSSFAPSSPSSRLPPSSVRPFARLQPPPTPPSFYTDSVALPASRQTMTGTGEPHRFHRTFSNVESSSRGEWFPLTEPLGKSNIGLLRGPHRRERASLHTPYVHPVSISLLVTAFSRLPTVRQQRVD